MIDRIAELRAAAEADIDQAGTAEELERARVRHLGRNAVLPQLLRGVAALPVEERGAVGRAGNEARAALEAQIARRSQQLDAAMLDQQLVADRIDVTLPGSPPRKVGRMHVISSTRREVEDIFLGLGYSVLEGPEIELSHYNFDALNHSPTHPAREPSDTFYVSEGVVLRTHTSPVQIRAMEAGPPPLFVIIPGRVYRPDDDATHTPQFHQVEGLAVDEDITLADLKGTLLEFARAFFGDTREVRMRPHFFPFTEPSVEVDVSCFNCEGQGHLADGTRCPLCKGEGWLELLGAGEVDPAVFAAVGSPAYDPERVQGFAFGVGIDRLAMLRHGIPHLGLLFDNDTRFLEQFG
jgi:phenylalanyl-tRNA synthetase alpha chain